MSITALRRLATQHGIVTKIEADQLYMFDCWDADADGWTLVKSLSDLRDALGYY